MKNVMVDIETMGNSVDAAIMSVGACYFDPETGEVGDTFHEKCSLESSVQSGLNMDPSTVIWWMSQDYDARSKFFKNQSEQPVGELLSKLAEFINEDVKVWGNGSTFDNTILKSAYRKVLGCDVPWMFWNDRDVRTIVELGQNIDFDPKRDMPFEGVRHDALDDAIHQAKYVSAIWQKLTNLETDRKNAISKMSKSWQHNADDYPDLLTAFVEMANRQFEERDRLRELLSSMNEMSLLMSHEIYEGTLLHSQVKQLLNGETK